MARRQTYTPSEETECNVASDSASPQRRRITVDLVRTDNRPFESPRGRGRNNPGWGRVGGMPFVSPRGRGRRIPVQTRSEDPDTDEHSEPHTYDRVQQFTAPDGTLYQSGLIRLDNRPFESPRGRGRLRSIRGRNEIRPNSSQSGHVPYEERSYTPSAPAHEDIMDVDD